MHIGQLPSRWTHRAGLPSESQQSAAEAHRQELERLLEQPPAVWHRVGLCCDACGRALLVGERPLIMRRDEELLVACWLCGKHLGGEGWVRAGLGPVIGTEQELELVNRQEMLAI